MSGTYIATPVSATTLHLVFSTPLEENPGLVDPGSYTITDMELVPLPVQEVLVRSPYNVELTVPRFDSGRAYQITLGPALALSDATPLEPRTNLFSWVEPVHRLTIPLRPPPLRYPSEPPPRPQGKVFFSPSLEEKAPLSTIQVSSVATCAQPYDTYKFPPTPEPNLVGFHTYGAVTCNLNTPTHVLWGPWYALTEVTWSMQVQTDVFNPYSDSPAIATLVLPFGVLNDDSWVLFDGGATCFTLIDNRNPIDETGLAMITLQA